MLKLQKSSFLRICEREITHKKLFSLLPINFGFREEKHGKRFHTFAAAIGISCACYALYERYKLSLSFPRIYEKVNVPFPKVEAIDLKKSDDVKSPRETYNFLADVAEKTAPSVVYIEIVARHPLTHQNIPVSNGSGFIVRSDGLILTNAHVVSHSQQGRVKVKLYSGEEYEGRIEHFDNESDLATVRIKANNLPVLPLGKSSNLRPGEFVIAMGNPLTLSHTITAGVISSANRQGKELGLHKKTDYIQTDAAVNAGNSGGPLVNLDCEAIGINSMKVTEGISFAVPSDTAVEFLKKVEESKSGGWMSFRDPKDVTRKRKYLGITMLTLTPSIIHELQQRNPEFPDVKHGVMVWRVMHDSPSYESGIRAGDIISTINGKEIHASNDIYNFLQTEDVLNIHVMRGKIDFDVTVTLMDPVI